MQKALATFVGRSFRSLSGQILGHNASGYGHVSSSVRSSSIAWKFTRHFPATDGTETGASSGLGVVQRQSSARASSLAKKEALQYIAHGLSAVMEADRVLPYTDPDDFRLEPLLKKAKENFELALEVDNSNTDAMLLLSRLHMYYHIPGACPASGAALLESAADAGNPVAQYELVCRLRAEGKLIGIGDHDDGMDEKALKYLELAACQKHPGALFLMGSIYLAGKHTKRDVKAAAWCFQNAADQGHTAAATVYGALMARDLVNPEEFMLEGDERQNVQHMEESARHYFEVAAEADDVKSSDSAINVESRLLISAWSHMALISSRAVSAEGYKGSLKLGPQVQRIPAIFHSLQEGRSTQSYEMLPNL